MQVRAVLNLGQELSEFHINNKAPKVMITGIYVETA